MTAPRVLFTAASGNSKTGPIVASYVSADTCPPSCPLQGVGCYGEVGHAFLQWRKTTDPLKSLNWDEYLARLQKVEPGRLFRHGIVGDLPGIGERLDVGLLDELVSASRRLKGFAFTHKKLEGPGEAEAVREANLRGFTINLSADSLVGADRKADLGVAPVVTILPSDPASWPSQTPSGRRVVVCPAVTHGVTCLECRLCARPNRKVCVGFPAHSSRKRAVDKVFYGS